MTTYLIPLENIPQKFNISLAGQNFIMISKWNDSSEGGWVIDLYDQNTNNPIAMNIPMITGLDLLTGLEYLGINGKFVVYTDGDEFAVPTLENLGVESNLYFLTSVANG